MELTNLDQVIDIIKKSAVKKTMAVAQSADEHTLDAVVKSYKDGLITPLLFGDVEETKKILESLDCDPSGIEIVAATDDADAAALAVAAVHEGRANLLMKGKLQTGDLMRAVIDKDNGILGDGVTSLFTINEMNHYNKLLVMTDSGIVRDPTFEQKVAIIKNAVSVLHAYGYEKPKVAALCAVETVNPKMPETVDAEKLQQMSRNGELGDCIVEGPLSMDIAMSDLAAKYKGIESEVAGKPDILLWPNVLTGNIALKAIGCFGGMTRSVSFSVGAKVPIVMTSRGTDMATKYLSILGAAAASNQ